MTDPLKIEPFSRAFRPFTFQFPQHEKDGNDPDWDVDIKNTPPAEILGQDATEERPEGKPEVDCSDIYAEGLSPLAGRIHRSEYCDCGTEDHGTPDPLEDPDPDQHSR